MDHIDKLIWLYSYVSECYDNELRWYCQRFSHNTTPAAFSDKELITIYLFEVLEEQNYQVKQMHKHIKKYLLSWFPGLPSYQRFNKRLNELGEIFPLLLNDVMDSANLTMTDWQTSLGDSMPVVVASAKRSSSAKSASMCCNKGYCASKDMYYYGVKVHSLAFRRPGRLPLLEQVIVSRASDHDLTIMRPYLHKRPNRRFVLDKAYCDQQLAQHLEEKLSSELLTPNKKKKGEPEQAADRLWNTMVSRVRQPIESLFNWIEEKTSIQTASKVRSAQGLKVHIFGKLTAAMIAFVFPIFN